MKAQDQEQPGDAGALAEAGSRKPEARPGAALPFALFALYFIWGSTYLGIRIALPGFPPLLLAGLRYLSAGGLLFAVLRLRGAALPTALQWRNAFLIGALLCLSNGLVCVAEQWVSSGVAAVLIASMPLWLTLFAAFAGTVPLRSELLGLAVGMCGVVVLNLGGELRASPLGAGLLVISAIAWALGSVLTRRMPLPAGMMASAAQMLCGGVVVLASALLRGERMHAFPALAPLLAFVYLVLFGSIVAFSSYVYVIGKLRPALATSYAYVNPAVAVGLGALVLHEKVAPTAVFALLLILAGIALITLGRRRA